MAKDKSTCCEKFKTVIGGQALIEGILMRGPEKEAIVCRKSDGLDLDVKPRKTRRKHSPLNWFLIRGVANFFDAQVNGIRALMHSADLSEEFEEESTSKFDQWLEKKLGNERFQKWLVGSAVALGLVMSVGLFFLLPMILCDFLEPWIGSGIGRNLVEGLVRIILFITYMVLVSRMKDMRRVFSYHGAEHKTIRCYEAGLPLTVENVRKQSRMHPRCGTSFLLVVMVLSILVFSLTSELFLMVIPGLAAMKGTFLFRLIMIVLKLAMLPVVVAFSYEINRFVGRHDNWFTRIIMAPGMWFQHFTTNEPDDSMIEVGIAALEAVIPEKEGADRW